MWRILFILLLVIHGLIHLTGFTKELGFAQPDQLSEKTLLPISAEMAQVIGAFWILSCLLFLLTAVLFFLKKEWWWIVGLGSILLSQTLIILYWQDAKFGTVANIIVLINIIPAYGYWDFSKMTKNEISSFVSDSISEKNLVSHEMVSSLPSVIQRWMIRSGVVGKEIIHTGYVEQKGKMKTASNADWIHVEAYQYFNLSHPGFIWVADVAMNQYLHLSGRDKYQNGKGHMLIKAMSLIPVADSRGKEIDQGTMLRFLGESVWFPSFALSEYLKWEEIDSSTARVSMNYKGVSASGILKFTAEGDLVSFEAKRFYDRKEGATLEDWIVVADPDGYKEFEGIRVPAIVSVTWRLKSGDFTWFNVEITDINYNLNDRPFKN